MARDPSFLIALLMLLACAATWIDVQAGAQSQVKSVRAGVYTKDQAERGQQIYAATCAACHGDDLSGLERAPALVGSDFDTNWNNQPLTALVTKIRTMPPTQPNTLSRPEIVEMIAYLLSAAGLPPGDTALSDDNTVLSGLIYEPMSPTHQ